MKKVLGLILVSALFFGGISMIAYDPGTGGHAVTKAAYDPGTGGH